jgi:hypothetical protein
MENMTPKELIKHFEGDILYDCHSFRARIGRSLALREIVRRGTNILPDLVAHLERTNFAEHGARAYPSGGEELACAWAVVLGGIERDHGLTGAPQVYSDKVGWLAWAKSQIQQPIAS